MENETKVYGGSDDLIYFEGKYIEEAGFYEGDGVVGNEFGDEARYWWDDTTGWNAQIVTNKTGKVTIHQEGEDEDGSYPVIEMPGNVISLERKENDGEIHFYKVRDLDLSESQLTILNKIKRIWVDEADEVLGKCTSVDSLEVFVYMNFPK